MYSLIYTDMYACIYSKKKNPHAYRCSSDYSTPKHFEAIILTRLEALIIKLHSATKTLLKNTIEGLQIVLPNGVIFTCYSWI